MSGQFQPFKLLAREAGHIARAALRRGALISVAVLIATLGLGFLLFATFVGLRDLLGPGIAALVMGAALLVFAVTLVLIARGPGPGIKTSVPAHTPQGYPITQTSTATDAATTAVFVAAFLLGRQLSDNWSHSRNS